MKVSNFRDQIDHDRIVAAIRAAEERSRGEIRVHVVHHSVGDAESAAAAAFTRLGMTATAERNGVLIYVAPRSQRFAVMGDTAIHGRCGDAFWRGVAATMQQAFRDGRFTDGIVEAIAAVGQALTREFPRVAGKTDENELPDAVSEE
jgi:uncharacterized membrane protein